MANKMVFKTRKPSHIEAKPIIRLTGEVSSRLFEIVEQTGLTPSNVIGQMLDYIGDDYEVN